MNTITIGIPCYNQAEYLPQAIESAMSQTIPCEVIVVNDGSKDNTLEVARKYSVKVINQVNKGLSAARNSAIMASTGSWFLPLDADDFLETNAVERLLRLAESTGADVVAPSLREFGISSAVVILMQEPKLKDFLIGNRIPYCSLIRKSALLECGGYSPRMEPGYEDYALWFDLLTRGKRFISSNEVLFNYRTKPVSMITEAKKHHTELMNKIYKDFPQILPGEIRTVSV